MSPTYSVCRNHGYIVGEVKKCPTCGETTEVYSRITGYYRPISNWNDGKTKEFDMRKEYVLKDDCKCEEHETKAETKKEKTTKDSNKVIGYLLFGTKTCPNCEVAKRVLSERKVSYEFIDAEDMTDMTQKYQVMSAPTLISITPNGYDKIVNVSNIINYFDNKID